MPTARDLFVQGLNHQQAGRLDDARRCYEQVLKLDPYPLPRLMIATMLPQIYQSTDEMLQWRKRLIDSVRELIEQKLTLDLTNDFAVHSFLPAYHGMDNRDLARQMAQLYRPPGAVPTAPRPRPAGDSRIRIGFISSYFKEHTIGRLSQGLISAISRKDFSVTVLSIGNHTDAVARAIANHCDRYGRLTGPLPAMRRAILDADLDVLYYCDIGMEPATYTLAFSRLAPVQCVTWGHPVTTGIDTIDYFISSEALDLPAAQENYTEKLVRLKDLAIYYYRPKLSQPAPGRAQFGLPPDAHIYGCPQSLYKFHPEFDQVIGPILRGDPKGLFVVLTGMFPHWNQILLKRFQTTMPDVAGRIRFVPRQDRNGFLALNAACDVLLDPLHFGGGNTSYEAFSLGVPIVTLPSQFLRGRITLAQYTAMGVLDCVAADPQHYVQIALGLGTDPAYRESVRQKILAANHVLFENLAGVRQLEEFLKGAVRATCQ